MITSFVESISVDLSSGLSRSTTPKYKFGANSTRMSKTPASTNTSKSFRTYTLIAVAEGRGSKKGTIGMAVMDIRFPVVDLYEFIDSTSYLRLKTKISVEDPVEVIVAESLNEKKSTLLLIEAIKNASHDTSITTVQKRYFNTHNGAELVNQLANVEVSNCDVTIQKEKPYCMAACGALLKYVEFVQNMLFSGKSLKVNYRDVEKICMIDVGSWKCLELVDNCEMSTTKSNRRSLLSVVNHTQTPSGFRLLRSNLLQPLADKEAINARFDAVEELLTDMHLIQHLREIFRNVHEMENVLALCVQSDEKEEDLQKCENNITQLLNLKQTLEVVLPIRRSFAGAKCSILKTIYEKLSDERVDEIMKILDDTLDLQAATKKNSLLIRNQRCYAVREGISVNLDVSRKAYEEMLRDLQLSGTAEELREYLPEQNVRLGYSISRGFHYSWAVREAMTIPLPPVFINIVRNRSSLTFSSKRLVRYNDRIDQCMAEVMLSSNVVVHHLIQQLRDLVPVLYNIMDATANIDFLTSLAIYSSSTESVRPVIGEALLFNRGRHPLLDCHLGDRCVPNDTYLTADSNFAVITGPNMAGKSTYLRQVCQLSVLAQLGCMVPADVAVVPVLTRIFSRVGHNDSLGKGLSAFALEMSEMAAILNYADRRSLIVIDELARSTSTEEGISISYAIAEHLLHQKSFVFLATHFLDLAALENRHITVENFHFSPQTRIDEDGVEVFDATHKLCKGPYMGPLYGFELVELSTFPPEVINNAKEMARQLKRVNDRKGAVSAEVATRKLLVRTALKLRHALALRGVSDKETLIDYVKDVRKAMHHEIGEIEEKLRTQETQRDVEMEDSIYMGEYDGGASIGSLEEPAAEGEMQASD